MKRRYYEALSGLWQRRHTHREAVTTIVDDALEEAEQWHREIPPELPVDTLWYGRLSADLRILEISGPLLAYMGGTAGQLHGKPLSAFASKVNLPIVEESARRALQSGQMVQAFLRDDKGRMMVLHVRPVDRDGEKEILCFAHYIPLRLYQREARMVAEL